VGVSLWEERFEKSLWVFDWVSTDQWPPF